MLRNYHTYIMINVSNEEEEKTTTLVYQLSSFRQVLNIV